MNQYDFIVSSKNASYKSDLGSTFAVTFTEPISIPKEAQKCIASVQSGNFWWTIPNVNANANKIYLNVNTVEHVIQVPKGLYDVTSLRASIYRQMENAGLGTASVLDFPMLVEQNDSTSRIVLKFVNDSAFVTWNSDSMYQILGFEQGTVVGPFSNITNVSAPLVARFNIFDSIQFHSSFTNQGIPVNGRFYQTIASIPITVPVGVQQIYQPYNPPMVDCHHLIGDRLSRITFWLTGDDGQTLPDTNSEDWGLSVRLQFF